MTLQYTPAFGFNFSEKSICRFFVGPSHRYRVFTRILTPICQTIAINCEAQLLASVR